MQHNIKKIYRAFQTVRDILKDRGYIEDEDDETVQKQILLATDLEEMKKQLSRLSTQPRKALADLMMLRQHAITNELIYVFFVFEKLGVKTIKGYTEIMDAHKPPVKRALLVSVDPKVSLTFFALRQISMLYEEDGKIIEHFYLKDLQMNIIRHELQPKYELATEEEKEDVLKSYNITQTQLPRIPSTDPVAKYFGLQIGDLLKIKRYSETTGKYICYRICLE